MAITRQTERESGAVALPVVVSRNARAALVPAAVIGGACVVAGGLLAAVSAPAPSEGASWAAAYLVLVGGVAQIAFGFGRAAFDPAASTRSVVAHLVTWNVGNVCVLAGTLSGRTTVVDGGGVLLLAALLLLVRGLRRPPASDGRAAGWLLWAYRAVVLLLVISIPVGLVLARLRS